jgi:Ca-activated chloride channel family protein
MRHTLALALLLPAVAFAQAQQAQIASPESTNVPHGHRSGSITRLPLKNLKVTPLQLPDGKSGWKVSIPGGHALATPAVVGDTVFVGGGFGSYEFYAFDAKSGNARWAIKVSDDGPTAAVVADDKVVFNTESCTLFVVDAHSGKQLWSRWLGDPLMSQPAVADGTIYMAYPGGDGRHHLVALALADGKTRFDRAIAGDIISAPVVDGDSVYLTTFDGTVYRYERQSGKLAWQSKMNATSAPFIFHGQVHVAQGRVVAGKDGKREKEEAFRTLTVEGRLQDAVKARKAAPYLEGTVQDRSGYAAEQSAADSSVGFGGGAPATAKSHEAKANIGQGTVRGLWEFQGSRPLVVGKANYSTQGDSILAIEADSGLPLWTHRLAGDVAKVGGHLAAPPSYAGGKLVVAGTSGDVIGYDAQSGKELFRYGLREEIRFQPALAGGSIFVGTTRGTLVCIATGDHSLDGWTMWGGGPRHNGPETVQHAQR